MLHLLALADVQTPAEDQYNFMSITGVIAVTFMIVEGIKKMVKPTTPYVGKIPILFFPILIAPILAILANKVFKQDNGIPFLTGNLWIIIGRAILGAASSSGLYTWLREPSRTVGDAQPLIGSDKSNEDNTMKPNFMFLAPLLLLPFICGCQSNPEKVALREAMDGATNQIRTNEKAWATKLVAYPVGTTDPRTGKPSDGKNKASEIPPLTPAQYTNEQAAHKAYEDLVNEDRARDTGTVK